MTFTFTDFLSSFNKFVTHNHTYQQSSLLHRGLSPPMTRSTIELLLTPPASRSGCTAIGTWNIDDGFVAGVRFWRVYIPYFQGENIIFFSFSYEPALPCSNQRWFTTRLSKLWGFWKRSWVWGYWNRWQWWQGLQGDTDDRTTGFTGQWASQGPSGLYWALLGCSGLY